jgi:hypothetical protein
VRHCGNRQSVRTMGAQRIPPEKGDGYDDFSAASFHSYLSPINLHKSFPTQHMQLPRASLTKLAAISPFSVMVRTLTPRALLRLDRGLSLLGGGGVASAGSSSSSTMRPHEAAPRTCVSKTSSSPTAPPRWTAHPLPSCSYWDALLGRGLT